MGKVKKGLKHIRNLSKTAHKPYVIVLFEIVRWILILKGRFSYYMDYQLYLKGKKMGDYMAPGEFHRLAKELNSPEYYSILEDKYFFSKILEGNGFRSPQNLYLVDPSGIYDIEFRTYIAEKEFLQKDIDGFCKLINGYGGGMIYQLEVVSGRLLINKESRTFSDFKNLLGHNKYLIQKRIVQHPEMNVLNPSCINTLRMLTMRTGQTIHLFQDYLRVGINNNYVDNGMSGNIMVGIREDGSLMDNAYSSGKDAPTYAMDRHPQTNIKFSDFTIPCYSESVEVVKSLHQLYQQFFMIGWDIGITPDGPIVIEGNNITTLYSYQLLYGGMKSAFKKLADSYRKQL